MRTAQRKEVLTTGDVAAICHVAPRTVSKWFDTGQLRGYRIPGSRDRRIPVEHLVAFMRAHGIPLRELEGGCCRVMLLGDVAGPEAVQALSADGRYQVQTAVNGFEAGVIAQRFRPHVVVLEAGCQPQDAAAICRNIKAAAELAGAKVIAAADDPAPERVRELLGLGFDGVLIRPASAAELSSAIELVTNLIA